MKIPDAKAAVVKEWKKLETMPVWNLEKMKNKKDAFSGSTKGQKRVHFASLGQKSPQTC